MLSVARSLEIHVPPERVYRAFVDLDGWLDWVPHFRELTPLDDGPLRPGFRARLRTRLSPVPSVWEVTELQDGRSFAWAYGALPGLRLTVDHLVEPADGGTRATLALYIEGPLGFFVSLVAGRLSRVTFDRSLAELKRLLEGAAGQAAG